MPFRTPLRGPRVDRCPGGRAVGNPAGRKDRQLEHELHLAQELTQPRGSLHVTTGLNPLSDENVGSGVRRLSGCGKVTDLRQDHNAGLFGSRYQLTVDTPGEGHEPCPSVEHHIEALLLVEVEHEVDAELRADGRANELELVSERLRVGPGAARVPSAPTRLAVVTSSTVVAGPIGACITGSFQGRVATAG